MAKTRRRPSEVIVVYRGIRFTLDLLRCRKALVRCQMEGKFDTTQELSGLVKISRSTASRFFSGRPTSLPVTRKIVTELGLRLDDVLRPVDPGDGPRVADGSAAAA